MTFARRVRAFYFTTAIMDQPSTPKVGLNRGNAGKGRPKGAPNKTTQAAKDAIAEAAAGLGGAGRLLEWAKEDPANERAFWTNIYPKLLPLQVNGAGTNGEHLISNITVRLVKPDAD